MERPGHTPIQKVSFITMSVFVSSPCTRRGVFAKAGCLKRFPPKRSLVAIFISLSACTISFRVLGPLFFTVIAKPNQEGSLCSVAFGNIKNSSRSDKPCFKYFQLRRRSSTKDSSRSSCANPIAAWISPDFKLYPMCEYVYL